MPPILLSLLGSKYFWGALVVALVLGKVWFWHHGVVVRAVDAEHQRMVKQIDAANERQREAVADWVLEMHRRVDAARETARQELAAQQADTEARIRKVRDYVTAQADRNCIVTRGFVLEREAAAAGTALPPAAGADVDAPSGVALSDVSANDVYNAGQFRQCVKRLKDFKDAWQREADAWNRFAADPVNAQ